MGADLTSLRQMEHGLAANGLALIAHRLSSLDRIALFRFIDADLFAAYHHVNAHEFRLKVPAVELPSDTFRDFADSAAIGVTAGALRRHRSLPALSRPDRESDT